MNFSQRIFFIYISNNKGEQLGEECHVLNVQEIESIHGHSNIIGKCIRQMSIANNPWKITLEVLILIL